MKSLKTKIVVLVLALGLCFVGLCCTTNDNETSSYSSSQTTDSESIFERTKKPPRVAIQGCVITKDDGHLITIRRKCEKCGNVENSSETRASISMNTTFTCRKCGNRQKLEIK
ncbi:MAG: hypothetical protein IJS60_02755 [Abditibacteriota bacterium]|nr:hypothetical protein [Abditibacteriota bacterium]